MKFVSVCELKSMFDLVPLPIDVLLIGYVNCAEKQSAISRSRE